MRQFQCGVVRAARSMQTPVVEAQGGAVSRRWRGVALVVAVAATVVWVSLRFGLWVWLPAAEHPVRNVMEGLSWVAAVVALLPLAVMLARWVWTRPGAAVSVPPLAPGVQTPISSAEVDGGVHGNEQAIVIGVATGPVTIHAAPVVPPETARPLDFSAIVEQKRRSFVGRQWLFDAYDSWHRGVPQERALLITGEPGIGKSAFMAELVNRTPHDELVAYHFCTVEDRGTLEPAAFVLHLAGMLAERLPSYAEQAESVGELVRADVVERDPGHALDQRIIAVLRRLPDPGDRLIVIDGLDEALQLRDQRRNLLTLLAPRLDRFPEWIRVVLSARADPEVLARLGEVRNVRIDAGHVGNLNDVRELVDRRLASPQWRTRLAAAGLSADDIARRLISNSGGNLLYVTTVLRAVELDRYRLTEIGTLPPGLSGVYRLFFDRLFEGRSYGETRGLLEVLVAAQAPLPAAIIGAASELDSEYELPSALVMLSTMMHEHDGRYALYHQSLVDWLTGEPHPFRTSTLNGHARLGDGFLAHLEKPLSGSTIGTPADPTSMYWVTYGLDHLAHSGKTLPPDVSAAAFALVALSPDQFTSYAVGDWTRSMPSSMRLYVEHLARRQKFDDILTFTQLLTRVATHYYVEDGLLQQSTDQDGRVVCHLTNKASDPLKIIGAFKASGHAGAVVRAALDSSDLKLTADQAAELKSCLRGVKSMAGGFEIVGWADELSGFFADAGRALCRGLHKLAAEQGPVRTSPADA